MAVWEGPGAYKDRVNDLRTGGQDGLYAFNACSITDDGSIDQLYGEKGSDWFWVFGADTIDKKNNEVQN
jgi:hypothetical protein